MTELPTGTVSFLFTDIEGSTRLLQELGDLYRTVQDRHAEILRTAFGAEDGHEVRTVGDGFFVIFQSPVRAVRAAATAQRSLAAEEWAHGAPLRVRMGIHTGDGVLGGGDYIGIDVNRAARIAAAGYGGQILISDATRALVEHALPEGIALRDLGRHRLKDIEHPERLHDLIIEGLPADFPPIRSLGGARTNLPTPRTSFVGRDRETAEVGELLTRTRLLTLTGPGGTGKTRLALRVAADQLARLEHGVILVDLSTVTDPAAVPSTIAASLGFQEEPTRDTLDAVADFLEDQDLLLVLDNVEQVVEAAPAVSRLLDAAPRLTILATSRVPLHLSGEHEYQVEPLPLPDPAHGADLAALSRCESVMLFEQRAAAVRRGFRITEENAAAVAEIARRVDGLPLAIELAAGHVKMLSPQAVLRRLELRLPLLTGGPRDAPERQRTLRGAIEWSVDLLEPGDQRLFARLAAFRGGWTLEAAEAVCGPGLDVPVIEGLSSLVDKSLIQQEQRRDGDVRFGMLETIVEYAYERLAGSGDLEEIRTRHAELVRDLAEKAEPHLSGEGQFRWMERLEAEHDNVRAALDWAEGGGDPETALRTAGAIWRFWQDRGFLAEARGRVERLLELPGAEARTPARARALGALGGIAYWQGDYKGTLRPYAEAVEIARKVGEPRLLARALFDLSFVPLLTAQNYDASEQLANEALANAPDDDRVLQGQIWAGLGYLRAFRGDPAAGIERVERAIAIHREIGDRVRTAEGLIGLAGLRLMTGKPGAARTLLREAVALLAEPASPMALAMSLTIQAVLASQDGDHHRAARLIGGWSRLKEEGVGSPPSFGLAQLGDPESSARAALGDEAYERAHAEGFAMTVDEARADVFESEASAGP